MKSRWTISTGNFEKGYTSFKDSQSVFQYYRNEPVEKVNVNALKIEHERKNATDSGKYSISIWLNEAEQGDLMQISCTNFVFDSVIDKNNYIKITSNILEVTCSPEKKDLLLKFITWVNKTLDPIDDYIQKDMINKIKQCPLPNPALQQETTSTTNNSKILNPKPLKQMLYNYGTCNSPSSKFPQSPTLFKTYSHNRNPQEKLNKLIFENQIIMDTTSHPDQILLTFFDFKVAAQAQIYLLQANVYTENKNREKICIPLSTSLEMPDEETLYNLSLTHQQFEQAFGKDSLDNLFQKDKGCSLTPDA